MELYAPPISHDNVFFYYGGHPGFSFYVKVESRGVFHQHPRADPSYLYSLLTHQAPNGLAAQTSTHFAHANAPIFKDETEHFYCAQLLHYGLKPLRTKAPAKKALLAAFGSGNTLVVPKHILELEERLKQEYEATNVQLAPMQDDSRTGGQTHGAGSSRGTAEVSAQAPSDIGMGRDNGGPQKVVTKVVPQHVPRKKATTVKSNGKKSDVTGSKKLTHVDISGYFDVEAPALSDEWPDMCRGGFTLRMSPSRKTRRHLWASFDFGIITGVMRCSKPPRTAGGMCTFTWRGEESSEGQMLYGASQKGTITFLGDGKLQGTIQGAFFGQARFTATANTEASENKVWCMYIKQWKNRYRGINASAYELAAATRWGGWAAGTSRPDRPAESDSSAAPNGSSGSERSQDEYEDDSEDDYAFADAPVYTAERATGINSHDSSQPPARGQRTKQTARKSAYNARKRSEGRYKPAEHDGGIDDDEPLLGMSRTKQTARKTNDSRPEPALLDTQPPPTQKRRTKETARKSGYRVPYVWRNEGAGDDESDFGYEGYTDDDLDEPEQPPLATTFARDAADELHGPTKKYRTKQTARKSAYQIPKRRKAQELPPEPGRPDVDRTTGATTKGKGKAKQAKLKHRDTSGSFDMVTPELSNGWPYEAITGFVDPPKLTLQMLPSTSRLWISFNFGVLFGIMRCSGTPLSVGETCTFTWRGKEGGDGVLTFGEENVGQITFLGNGRIDGVIEGSFFGRSTFSGTRTSERTTSKVWKNYLREWKTRYRSINYTAYAIANRARWGGGSYQQSHTEGPEASDTSDEEMEVDPDYVEGIYDPPYTM